MYEIPFVVPETAIKLAMRNGSLQSIYWLPIQNLIKGIGLVIWNYPPLACDFWTTVIRHIIGSMKEIVLSFVLLLTTYYVMDVCGGFISFSLRNWFLMSCQVLSVVNWFTMKSCSCIHIWRNMCLLLQEPVIHEPDGS